MVFFVVVVRPSSVPLLFLVHVSVFDVCAVPELGLLVWAIGMVTLLVSLSWLCPSTFGIACPALVLFWFVPSYCPLAFLHYSTCGGNVVL